jgi:hypothetical protein
MPKRKDFIPKHNIGDLVLDKNYDEYVLGIIRGFAKIHNKNCYMVEWISESKYESYRNITPVCGEGISILKETLKERFDA